MPKMTEPGKVAKDRSWGVDSLEFHAELLSVSSVHPPGRLLEGRHKRLCNCTGQYTEIAKGSKEGHQ